MDYQSAPGRGQETIMSTDIPRRVDMRQWVPAEHAIRLAMLAVCYSLKQTQGRAITGGSVASR